MLFPPRGMLTRPPAAGPVSTADVVVAQPLHGRAWFALLSNATVFGTRPLCAAEFAERPDGLAGDRWAGPLDFVVVIPAFAAGRVQVQKVIQRSAGELIEGEADVFNLNRTRGQPITVPAGINIAADSLDGGTVDT